MAGSQPPADHTRNMHLHPSFPEFQGFAREASLVPVYSELLFDTETAVSAYQKLARPPFGFLLESVVGGETWARYTFLGTEPRAAWRLDDGRVDHWAPASGWTTGTPSADPLEELCQLLLKDEPAHVPGLPRFWGGAVGFFGYDVVRLVEHLPDAPPAVLDLPDALFIQTGAVLAIDNLFGRAKVIVPVETTGADEAELRRRYEAAGVEIATLVERLQTSDPPAPLTLSPLEGDPAFESRTTRGDYEGQVRRIQEYIHAGDVFQVVLSQRLSMPLEAPPFDLYRVLRTVNPSPYLFFLDLDGFQLVGSSPEVLVRMEEGKVLVRPIAGTRPRGETAAEDAALAQDLLADPKELAEHLMLVDLGRNDVGRVANIGSVELVRRMEVERYSHVMHIVSEVRGKVSASVPPLEVVRAAFPAGTLSGAPKVRPMQIIAELEA
ncbi:MAG: chorismate-binding protein, partial [Gemmatimonadetes bacterium]|nr:chorismate-binding protein [Gemmatimonadota bacterium]